VVAQVPTNRVPARITSFGGHVVRPWQSSVTLACNAVGEPTRDWLKGSTEQIRTDTARNVQILPTGELLMSNLQSQDSGNYTCQVENSQGSDKLHYTLTVQGDSPRECNTRTIIVIRIINAIAILLRDFINFVARCTLASR
jgi:hypothetical protein